MISAGIIYYRWNRLHELEVFLVHSTGNYPWLSFPKGLVEPNEGIFPAALREFQEETDHIPSYVQEDYVYLGKIRTNYGKTIHAFATEADINPADCRSNWCEFPPHSGRMIPELDGYYWLTFEEACARINPQQKPLLDSLAVIKKIS